MSEEKSQEEKNLEEILSESEANVSTEKYDYFIKSITLAHYLLFTTVVWKSFDLQGDIPTTSKVSLWFFLLGIIVSVLSNISHYFCDVMGDYSTYRKIATYNKEHGEDLRERNPEEYKNVVLISRFVEWSDKKFDLEKVPSVIFSFFYYFVSMVSLMVSALLLLFGLFLLAIGAI